MDTTSIGAMHRMGVVVHMNPVEAQKKGIKDGEVVRIVTKAGSVKAPVEYSWKMAEGYSMLPHQFGLKNENQPVYGEGANKLTSHEEYDEISFNPTIRYVACRIEKIEEEARA